MLRLPLALLPAAKEISISLSEKEIHPGQEIQGIVTLNYVGRFDSVVINSQIERTSDIFTYVALNGKKINYPYARLYILRADLGDRKSIEFTAKTQHVPLEGNYSNAKFRASIIQEHKEVSSDISFVKLLAS